jgi:hypothetical protein
MKTTTTSNELQADASAARIAEWADIAREISREAVRARHKGGCVSIEATSVEAAEARASVEVAAARVAAEAAEARASAGATEARVAAKAAVAREVEWEVIVAETVVRAVEARAAEAQHQYEQYF